MIKLINEINKLKKLCFKNQIFEKEQKEFYLKNKN